MDATGDGKYIQKIWSLLSHDFQCWISLVFCIGKKQWPCFVIVSSCFWWLTWLMKKNPCSEAVFLFKLLWLKKFKVLSLGWINSSFFHGKTNSRSFLISCDFSESKKTTSHHDFVLFVFGPLGSPPGKDTIGSQFYITLRELPFLDGKSLS